VGAVVSWRWLTVYVLALTAGVLIGHFVVPFHDDRPVLVP
jgi:hypothetical protein